MLGFYPWPRIFWKWAWKLVSPAIVTVSIFCIILYLNANKTYLLSLLSNEIFISQCLFSINGFRFPFIMVLSFLFIILFSTFQ